jgi:hypothetical protein
VTFTRHDIKINPVKEVLPIKKDKRIVTTEKQIEVAVNHAVDEVLGAFCKALLATGITQEQITAAAKLVGAQQK